MPCFRRNERRAGANIDIAVDEPSVEMWRCGDASAPPPPPPPPLTPAATAPLHTADFITKCMSAANLSKSVDHWISEHVSQEGQDQSACQEGRAYSKVIFHRAAIRKGFRVAGDTKCNGV